jgi:hypothetical protein
LLALIQISIVINLIQPNMFMGYIKAPSCRSFFSRLGRIGPRRRIDISVGDRFIVNTVLATLV